MDVNSAFSQIESFWDSISVPIVFHIIFFLLYRFIFRGPSLRTILEGYSQSKSFENSKNLLEKFELWKKLPIIFLFSGLIYLTVFNSLTNFISSINIFPIGIAYAEEDFLREYEPREDILSIASYRLDTTPKLEQVLQFKSRLLEEYKIKYPDNYSTSLDWTNTNFSKKMNYVTLTTLVFVCLLLLTFRALFIKGQKNKFDVLSRFILVILLIFPLLFVLRYQEEQVVEEQFAAQIMFVKNSLEADIQRKPQLDSGQIIQLKSSLDEKLRNSFLSADLPWISRYVGHHKWTQTLLGNRRLITRATDDFYQN